MIVRHYITCSTCYFPHTLRIQVGHNPYQEHSFHCTNCGEEIVIGMDCFPQTATVNIRQIENAEIGNNEGAIINLSPEFPIAAKDLHRDLAFPSTEYIERLVKAQLHLGVKIPSFNSIEEARDADINYKSFSENWAVIKKGWSLTGRGRLDLAENQLTEYSSPNFNAPYQLNYVLFDFVASF